MAQIVTAVLAAVLNFTAFGQLKPLCCSFMSFELSMCLTSNSRRDYTAGVFKDACFVIAQACALECRKI